MMGLEKQQDGKKPKREIAELPGDKVASIEWNHADRLEYNGKRFIKMSRIMGRSIRGPHRVQSVQLWLCIEVNGSFPARTVIVPEFLK